MDCESCGEADVVGSLMFGLEEVVLSPRNFEGVECFCDVDRIAIGSSQV